MPFRILSIGATDLVINLITDVQDLYPEISKTLLREIHTIPK